VRYLLAGIFSLVLLTPVWALTPTHDASSSSGSKLNQQTTSGFTHTAGTISNGIAIIRVASQDSTPGTISGVTYNGQAATQCPTNSPLATGGGGSQFVVSLWYYKLPPAGSSAVVASFSEVMNWHAIVVSTYANVNQTTPIGTCAAAADFDTTAPSEARVTVTSAVGELVVAVAGFRSTTNTPTTSQNNRGTALTSTTMSIGGSDADGAATVNMSWSDAGSFNNAIIGVSLKPSVDRRPVPPMILSWLIDPFRALWSSLEVNDALAY
jgi:hypothetical protein